MNRRFGMNSRITSDNWNNILDDIQQNTRDTGDNYANRQEHRDVEVDIDDYVQNVNPSPNQDSTKPKVLLSNNSWTDDGEKLVTSIGNEISSYRKTHEGLIESNKSTSNVFNVIFIVLTVLLTTITSIESNEDTKFSLDIVRYSCTYLLTVLSLVYNFFSFEEHAAKHSEAAKRYNKLYNKIMEQISYNRPERIDARVFIPAIQKDFINIKQDSITVRNVTLEVPKQIDQKPTNTALESINTALQIGGDLKDKDIENMADIELEYLNRAFISKRSEYEYGRFMNHHV